MKLFLKCPDCKGVINVESAAGLEDKEAQCPHCQAKHKIREFLPKYSFKVDGRNYQLHLGRQWVGRQHNASDAEVQIPDESRYMSRRHAIVELKCTASGIRCTFEEHGKNPTTMQGVELCPDDIIYLNVNDCLQMGGKKMYLAHEYQDS